jgi:2-octaprenylphenol hydroxylase
MSRSAVDIAIVGGGPVGAALGALLCRGAGGGPRRRVCLIEARLPPPVDAPRDPHADLRVVALSRASQRVLQAAGAWTALAAAPGVLGAYERMHVWPGTAQPRTAGSLTFDAAEIGEPDLGHIVANARVQRAALEAFVAAGGEVCEAPLRTLAFDADGATLATDEDDLRAALVVGADGGRSAVREAAGLGVEAQEYGQSGVVAVVRSEASHERTAWQRFLGHGTLALLPLGDGRCSIVWSVPRTRADELLAMPAGTFSAALTAASDGVLGALHLDGPRAAFPLRRVTATAYVRERCALVGDAAHIVHPLAGQGLNLGLLDAAALVEVLRDAAAEGEDPGALRVLRRYERWRKGENTAMGAALDLINRFLAFGDGPLGRLAQRGLGVVGGQAPLRRLFAEVALGLAGDLPDLARRAPALSPTGRSSPRR